MGLGSTDHFTPFQLSMNGLGSTLFWPREASATPVAQQSEAATQVTAVSRSSGVVGSGLGVVVQAEPFQCSTSVVDGRPSASMVAPTAQQFDEPVQVTALRYCPSGVAAAGSGDDGPGRAVPVLHQSLAARHIGVDTGYEVVLDLIRTREPDGPAVRRPRAGDRVELVEGLARGCPPDLGPPRSVPVDDDAGQGILVAVERAAHGPAVRRPGAGDREEIGMDVGCRHHRPGRSRSSARPGGAGPRLVGSRLRAHRPAVGSTDTAHTPQKGCPASRWDGVGPADHVDPFQRSTSASGCELLPRPEKAPPTAQQFQVLVHVVPIRRWLPGRRNRGWGRCSTPKGRPPGPSERRSRGGASRRLRLPGSARSSATTRLANFVHLCVSSPVVTA